MSNNRAEFLAHWAWCLPVLLAVAYLSIRQIDLFPPTPDEFFSMYNSGWLVNGPYSPLDVIESLFNNSPNHTPAYFILLSIWGNLTSYELAMGRVFSILCGMLSLSIVYRLARDFVAPVAGLFAIVILASNAFYNFYIPHVRMYPLLLLISGIVLWLYLRIIYQLRHAQRRDYVRLGTAVFLLANVHAFSVTFLITLAVYHLIFVARDRRWRSVIVTVFIAFVLFLPWFLVLVTGGVNKAIEDWGNSSAGTWDTIVSWLIVTTNGQPLLLAISIAGVVLSARSRHFPSKPVLMLVILYLLVLTLLTDVTPFVTVSGMRYQLPAWLFLLLFIVSGLYFLYCYKRWLSLLVLLWLVGGLSFQGAANWQTFIAGRVKSFDLPPWQTIAPLAAQNDKEPQIIGYHISTKILDWQSYDGLTQRQYYFDKAGVSILFAIDPHDFSILIRNSAIVSPNVWLMFQESVATTKEISAVQAEMGNLEYDLCDTIDVGIDTVILDYSWNVSECDPVQSVAQSQTGKIDHIFHGARVSKGSSTLYFADTWTPSAEFALEDYTLSYQLISPDWDNVAQLDLPMVHEGLPRRFSIDTSNVSAGTYRLMVVLYNVNTGERENWSDNEGFVPEMLTLAEIVIPERE